METVMVNRFGVPKHMKKKIGEVNCQYCGDELFTGKEILASCCHECEKGIIIFEKEKIKY